MINKEKLMPCLWLSGNYFKTNYSPEQKSYHLNANPDFEYFQVHIDLIGNSNLRWCETAV